MKKVHVLLGVFTFYEEQFDGVYKCIIHRIDEIVEIEEETAEKFCEDSLNTYEAYLIPEMYNGLIEIL